MLKLYYSKETLEKAVKENINELAGTFSQFYNLKEESRQKYLDEVYVPKVISIASSLKELCEKENYKPLKDLIALLSSTDKFDNFDPRYVQEFDGRWTKKIDPKANINQKMINISKRYNIRPDKEAIFILFNVLKYMSGKDIDAFELRMAETEQTDFKTLSNISKERFDYIECPFNENMDGFCFAFAKDKEIYARFKRDDFEVYLLQKLYNGILSDMIEYGTMEIEYTKDEIKRIYNKIKKTKIKLLFSDVSIEPLEKRLDSTLIASFFINKTLRNAVRTRTRLDLDGKGRDYFLAGKGLFADELNLNHAGDLALKSCESVFTQSTHNIGKLTVEIAGNDFGTNANFNSDEIYIKYIGENALSGSINVFTDHNIGRLVVENAGGRFGEYSNFNSGEVIFKNVGAWALSGNNSIFFSMFSKHNIQKLTVENGRDHFGSRSNINSKEVTLKNIGCDALSGEYSHFSSHDIEKLIVDNAGYNFAECSNINAKEVVLKHVKDRALAGTETKFCKHNIERLTVDYTKDNLGQYSDFNCGEIYIKKALSRALIGSKYKHSVHKIGKLTVDETGPLFGKYSRIITEINAINMPENADFLGVIIKDVKKWWEFWR